MVDRSELDSISIRGRVAFAITCLERVCDHLRFRNERIHGLIRFLWTYVCSQRLDLWEQEVANTYPFDDTLDVCAKWYGYDHLPPEQQVLLWQLILETVENIALGNLYGGYRSYFTREPTWRVAHLLDEWSIPLPSLRPFLKSKATERHGWGNLVDPAFFTRDL
jgi:hypothetical protein